MPTEEPEIASRIREVLELRGWSRREWSEKAGLSHGFVQLLESGRRGGRTGLSAIKALALAAGVRWEWLLDGTGARDLGGHDPEEMPESLREVMQHAPPRGRRDAWLPLTVQQLMQSWSYAGVERTQEEWIRLGDSYDSINRLDEVALQARRQADALRGREAPAAQVIDADVEAKRAAARAKRQRAKKGIVR